MKTASPCAGLSLALLLAGSALAQAPGAAPARVDPRQPPARDCDALPAQRFLGREASPILVEQVRQASGATRVWTLEPGAGIKAVMVEGRLLLDVDANGRIISAHCG